MVYDQAAQPQNMTFSQRKSWAEKSSDLSMFIQFLITSLQKFDIHVIDRKKTHNFEAILLFLYILIFNLTEHV